MWPARVEVANPACQHGSGVVEAEEQGLVQEFVPQPALEALADAILHRSARRDEAMKCHGTWCSLVQASIAFEVNSVP
jgi:hypothetical protein